MKKYLHYDATQFSLPRADVRVRTPGGPTPVSQGLGRQDALDLSSRPEVNVVAMVTSRKWGEEQDSVPLDLSGYTRQQVRFIENRNGHTIW